MKDNVKIKWVISFLVLLIIEFALAQGTTILSEATSQKFFIDTRAGKGPIETDHVEDITYSSLWNGNGSPTYCVIDLSKGNTASKWPVSYMNSVPEGGWTDEYKSNKLVLRRIEAGSLYNIKKQSSDRFSEIVISNAYYIGVFEVTDDQYNRIVGTSLTGGTLPRGGVSYNTLRGWSAGTRYPESTAVDDTSVIRILRKKTGISTLDLPTEAQWEYACRAGTTNDFNNGGSSEDDLKLLGRYAGNKTDGRGGSTERAAVGSYQPNAWGLYDMHGNVFEWCLDWKDVDFDRVMRGGSFHREAKDCRSGYRYSYNPAYEYNDHGFRLCCSAESIEKKCAVAVIAINDTEVKSATGEGVYEWTPPATTGSYVFTHTIKTNGVQVGETLTATFVVPSHEIEIDDGTGGIGGRESRFSYSGVYDGQGHGLSVEVESVENPQIAYALAKDGPYFESLLLTNACAESAIWYTVSVSGYNTYTNWATVTISPRPVVVKSRDLTKVYDGTPLRLTANDITADNLVEGESFAYDDLAERTAAGETPAAFTVSAGEGTKLQNYDITTEFGTLTVTKAAVGPGGGAEPGTGELPEGAASRFDAEVVYDGGGHTIDTNALVAAFAEATGGSVEVAYAVDAEPSEATVWGAEVPSFTNAGEYAVWYRVSNPNYEDFVHEAKVTISSRPVTLTSGTKTDFVYDGLPHSFPVLDESKNGFVKGEGVVTMGWAAVTTVGEGEVANTFDYAPLEGMDLANYAITVVTGKLAVVAAPIPVGPGGAVTAVGYTNTYDGAVHGIAVSAGGLLTTPTLVYATTEDGEWREDPPIYTGVCDTQVWYRVSAPNYAPVVGTVGIKITPRPITLSAPAKSKVYDGTPLTLDVGDVAVGGDGYAPGETFALSGFASITGAGEICADYAVVDDTARMDNYVITRTAGTLTVTPRPVTVRSRNLTKVYDGTPLRLTASDITADNLVEGESFVYGDLAERTAAGETPATFTVAEGENTKLANYDITTEYGTITITKAAVGPGGGAEPGAGELPEGAVSRFDAESVYDGEGHTIDTNELVAAFAGAMGGTVAVSYAADAELGEATGWGAEAPAFTNAGEYAVWYRASSPNYEDFVHEAKVVVSPHPVTVRSRDLAKVYDGTPLRLTADGITADNLVDGESFVYGDFAERTAAGETPAAFTVAAGEGTNLQNYDIMTEFGTITIARATYPGQEAGGAGIAWSVASGAADWMYDGRPHGVTLTGVPVGVTAHLAGNVATDAGEYTATVTFDYDAANYEPPVAPAPMRWTISPRPITLMAASREKPYDGFPLTVRPGDITASGSGYAEGECFDYFDFASITDVGETAATFGYRDSTTAKVSNYAVTVAGGQTLRVTVGGDQVSVTADSATWAYDGGEHRAASWSVRNGDKLLAGHELRVEIDAASVVRTPEDGPDRDGVVSNRFASVRIVEAATGADRTRNYSLVLREGVLRMTNACIRTEQISGADDIGKVYDGIATQAVVKASLLQPGTVRYWTDDTSSGTGRTEPPAFTHAGTQTVWYAVSAKYYDAYTNNLKVTILPRSVTLATPTKSKTYDGAPLSFGADEVRVGGDGFAVGESFAFSDFAAIADAGRIAATCTYAAGDGTQLSDYSITEDWGTLTVLASADEITVTAADGAWPYDATEHRLAAYTVENADKLRPGDELAVAFAPESVVLTPEDGPNRDGIVSNVIASVRVVRNGTEDVTRNYSLAWYPGILQVTRARVTFDREGSVDPAEFSTEATYDGAGHAAAVVPPVLLTAPVTVRYGTAADAVGVDESPAFTNAGVHTVFYTMEAPYYEPYTGTATVTISPRPVTLVSDGAEKVYDGTPLRNNSVHVKAGSPGFVAGEGFAATCSGALTDVGAMENLFDYELTGGAKAGNYAIAKEYGWLRVTPATLDAGTVFGGGETEADGSLLCALVYNGAAQPFALTPNFGDPYRLYYALIPNDESAYSETAPTRTHVAEGDLTVHFKFMSPNYAPYYGKGILRITPKTLTDAMVVADEDEAWFFDGTGKKPAVTVVDDNPSIATTNDYTLAYSDRTGAGLFPVTVTGTNNYCGTVTKEFAILKRPVAPPVIGDLAYNGKVRRPTVPADERWTVVSNPGGIDAGAYTNVVLRLTNPDDYRWKGLGADEAEWIGSFAIKPGGNAWRIRPGLDDWTEGDAPPEPRLGTPLYGTVTEILYRARGAAVETAVTNRPTRAGLYTVRFVVAATANYLGTYRDVDFEIRRAAGGTATVTTPVPVPYAWLDAYLAAFGGDYETAANATGRNGCALWASYVAGLDPTDGASQFRAFIAVGADGVPAVTWSPDLRTAEVPRTYTVYGKPTLDAADWKPVTDANRSAMRFFKVTVEIK